MSRPDVRHPAAFLLCCRGDQQPAKQRYQLFDLSKDPLAQHDLFKANPQLARELAEELAAFLEREIRFERNLAGDVTLDAETQADLGRLGYAE